MDEADKSSRFVVITDPARLTALRALGIDVDRIKNLRENQKMEWAPIARLLGLPLHKIRSFYDENYRERRTYMARRDAELRTERQAYSTNRSRDALTLVAELHRPPLTKRDKLLERLRSGLR